MYVHASTLSVLAVLATASSLQAMPQQVPAPLFAAHTGAHDSLLNELAVARSRAVVTDLALLAELGSGVRDTFRANLFDDLWFDCAVERVDHQPGGAFSLTARLVGEPHGACVVSYVPGALALNVFARTGDYQARTIQGALTAVQELDGGQYPVCGCGAQHAIQSPPSASDGPGATDDGSVIDVLVLWTQEARSAAGGASNIRAIAENAVAAANVAYTNSQIQTRLRLVHRSEANYSEAGATFNNHLSRLRAVGDGYMDEAHVLRDLYGADMVALLVADGQYCGLGYLMQNLSPSFADFAFSATNFSCAVGNLTFAHELGHNQGSQHDRGNAGSMPSQPYSYGWRWTGASGTLYRSVMSYAPGSRVPHFSNPSVLYDGVPTGVPAGQPDEADNARSINEALLTIANWRASVTVGVTTCAPGAPNSTGVPGILSASGTAVAVQDDLTLVAEQLPTGTFAMFLTSQVLGAATTPPGSSGNLCLGGGIGRYAAPGQIQSTGVTGRVALTLDLGQTPTPLGSVAVVPGETWHFQCWHRDNTAGQATSNFTAALSVLFE